MNARLGDVLATLRDLYPGSDVRLTTRRRARDTRRFILLLTPRRPRLLVPDDAPRAAARAARRDSAGDGCAREFARSALAVAVGSPVRRAFRSVVEVSPGQSRTIEDHLNRCLDVPAGDIRIAMSLGAARANRKPVLDVLTPAGVRLAFAKIASSALSTRLVHAEAEALAVLSAAGLRHVDVPRVIHASRWGERQALVLTPLEGGRGTGRGSLPVAAMREVSGIHGIVLTETGDSAWLTGLAERSGQLGTPLGERVRSAVSSYAAAHGPLRLGFGAWHGDWGPWNMSWSNGRPQVWDWERFARSVPVGLDAVHFAAHRALRRVGHVDIAGDALDRSAVRAVHLMGVTEPDAVRATVDAYLLEIAARFAADATEPNGEAGEAVAGWLLDLLDRRTVGESLGMGAR